jgi:adenylosuccinate synthase
MINFIDAVIGLQNGDEGKGAVASFLASQSEYNLVMRCQGGSNAGHTIYHNDKKIVTHIVPCGILHGKISLIGSGCVINEKKFFEEVEYLSSLGYDTSLIRIAKNAHVVTDEHIESEKNETKVGTTKQGIGPCVIDKYSRQGIRAESIERLQPYLVDLYEFLYGYGNIMKWNILVEGAQGFELDIDHGDYPYVTSSHTTLAGCLLNLLDPRKLRKVYGCAKVYETYVGSKQFQDLNEPVLDELAILGNEFGSTTGRKRQCNWLNLSKLIKAIKVNSCTDLVLSKCDILRSLNEKHENQYWKVMLKTYRHKEKDIEYKGVNFGSEPYFYEWLFSILNEQTDIKNIYGRFSPQDTLVQMQWEMEIK